MNEKKISKSLIGKRNRAAGARFELKIRKDLEKKGWIIDKWSNNVDLEKNKIIPAKRKYNPFKKIMIIGTGFPDFIGFKFEKKKYDIIGIEVKGNGWLNQNEKKKCKWLLDNHIFSKILIAKKGKKRGEIEYIDFEKKYNKI
tara:strand:+ start:2162 stop:2587 length:426 start_codon:yes stop_codon:yes gene_type:complete